MKRYISFISIFSIISIATLSCIQDKGNSDTEDFDLTKQTEPVVLYSTPNSECDHKADFGSKSICLPKIEGMTECYGIKKTKDLFAHFEYDQNVTLAIYLDDKTYQNIIQESLSDQFEDYFKVYAFKKFQDEDFTTSKMTDFCESFSKDFLRKNWSDVKRIVEEQLDEIKTDKPVLIEEYSVLPGTQSFVLLSKHLVKGNESYQAIVLNVAVVKKRMIWLAYYLNYAGEKSLERAKSKSDYFLLRFMDENHGTGVHSNSGYTTRKTHVGNPNSPKRDVDFYLQNGFQVFDKYGLAINLPVRLEDYRKQDKSNNDIFYAGFTDKNSTEKMVFYQLILNPIHDDYNSLSKKEQTRVEENLRSKLSGMEKSEILRSPAYIMNYKHNEYSARSLIIIRNRNILAFNIITNNDLDGKFEDLQRQIAFIE